MESLILLSFAGFKVTSTDKGLINWEAWLRIERLGHLIHIWCGEKIDTAVCLQINDIGTCNLKSISKYRKSILRLQSGVGLPHFERNSNAKKYPVTF